MGVFPEGDMVSYTFKKPFKTLYCTTMKLENKRGDSRATAPIVPRPPPGSAFVINPGVVWGESSFVDVNCSHSDQTVAERNHSPLSVLLWNHS